MKKKQIVDTPDELKLKHLEEAIAVIGIFESKGKYFPELTKKGNITNEIAEEILSYLQYHKNTKEDSNDPYQRRVRTAKNIFNTYSENFRLEGNKSGTQFVFQKEGRTAPLKRDAAYQSLAIIYLGLMAYRKTVDMDVLHQLFQQDFPLDLLTLLSYAIHSKYCLDFSYKNRGVKTLQITEFVPVKLSFKDSHWFLIGWEASVSKWNSYLIHSIFYLKLTSEIGTRIKCKVPPFDMKKFREKSFGASALHDETAIEIRISVPSHLKLAVQKRRDEGIWEANGEHWIWKIYTSSISDLLDYVFKWSGDLKILSPESVRQEFKTKLKKVLGDYWN